MEELPPVDIFVTTADAELEPPIITINTVLSLLAVDYPVNKLACYVSDDGGSPVTFYSLYEALDFAKIWVPFCKKYKVQVRAPFRFFYNNNNNDDDYLVSGGSPEFLHEWTKMKVGIFQKNYSTFLIICCIVLFYFIFVYICVYCLFVREGRVRETEPEN